MNSSMMIRTARRRARLTQAALAERVGTTQSAVARWERGRIEPSFDTLQRLVSACGLELVCTLRAKDEGEASLIESNLQLTAEQRLDQLLTTLSFIEAGRAAIKATGD